MADKKDDFSVKKISPKLGGETVARSPNEPASSHDLVEQMEFLYVQVIKLINTPKSFNPIVEIILGNHKSSAKGLLIGPNMDWNQVFAFDNTKDDVLSFTLSHKESETSTLIGKQEFKLASDIPSRVPPDAKIVPQWYYMQDTETGNPVMLLMSIWFGTQADEIYSQAYFSVASDVSGSCMVNTRPKLYLAPRLCYVRVTIVSAHDLISNDGKRSPLVYVRVTLREQVQETGISSGSNPSWKQDLIFVASEPLDDTVYISLIERVGDQQEECIGKLEKKLSQIMSAVPGTTPPALFYDIEPAVEGDSRRSSSRIKMSLATDQAYHVFEECSEYSSDYRAFAKGLWPGVLGKLEIGILGATGLETTQELGDGEKTSRDAYVVAKYGNKWARTRTVADSFSPKWNEQYSWDIYEKCTFVTLGIYDNYCRVDHAEKDVPIGKVRIPLSSLEWDRLYTRSFPMILDLGEAGLKKTGELHLAVRCVPCAQPVALATSRFRPKLPRAHYLWPLSTDKIEQLREEAVKVNCLNLAKTEPPLGFEVVTDMLKPNNRNLESVRRSKANKESLYRMVQTLAIWYAWFDANIRLTTDMLLKLVTVFICGLLLLFPKWIMGLAVYGALPGYVAYKYLCEKIKYYKTMHGIGDTPPPLKLDEDFAEKVVTFMGEAASWGERLFTLHDDPFGSIYMWVVFYMMLLVVCNVPYQILGFCLMVRMVNFPFLRKNVPSGMYNFLTRLPSKEELVLLE